MLVFETILGLLLGATILSMVARRLNVPYPTLLALGGASVAFLPDAPRLDLPSELILALFVAPVLLDAAYDASLRDLRENWRPVLSLVLVAVGLTTAAVAFAARQLLPDLALGGGHRARRAARAARTPSPPWRSCDRSIRRTASARSWKARAC